MVFGPRSLRREEKSEVTPPNEDLLTAPQAASGQWRDRPREGVADTGTRGGQRAGGAWDPSK